MTKSEYENLEEELIIATLKFCRARRKMYNGDPNRDSLSECKKELYKWADKILDWEELDEKDNSTND